MDEQRAGYVTEDASNLCEWLISYADSVKVAISPFRFDRS
jgi:hypothetical protein